MFIYILHSTLFIGQSRKIILSFPLPVERIEEMANFDNIYSDEKKWKVVERL